MKSSLRAVGQIVDQGMQVRFTNHRCFIEEEDQIMAQVCREWRLVILETNDVDTFMFIKGQKLELDINLWHKWIDHINFPRLQEMETKNIVFGLPKFSGQKRQVCEACQPTKQHRLPFPNERNRS